MTSMFEDFRQLRDEAAKEQDFQALQQLILEINSLLDVVEERLTKIEGHAGPVVVKPQFAPPGER